MKKIKLFYHGPNKGKKNFGDDLSPIIVREFTGRDVEYSNILNCDMIAIGSIIDTYYRWLPLRKILGAKAPVRVWGSGFIRSGGVRAPENMEVSAVRGPRTRKRLGLPDSIPLGDPGLLSRNFAQKEKTPHYAWGIVPHMADIKDPRIEELVRNTRHAKLIRLDDDPINTLFEISKCDRVVSTSLHGLIVSDSLGIPNYWLKAGDRLKGGGWKFFVYFESIGRKCDGPIGFPHDYNMDGIEEDFLNDHFNNIDISCRDLIRSIGGQL